MNWNKSILDTLLTVKIGKRFACASELCRVHFGMFELVHAGDLGAIPQLPPSPHQMFQTPRSP